MSKKLLPVLIGAALTCGVNLAAADVTLFGHIDTSFIGIDQDGGADDTVFRCTTCSVGFKGSEDLGNGLKAIFKLDFQYDTTVRNDGDGVSSDGDNDNSGLIDRDQWVGLAGGFGKVRIGTISTVYKSHGAMIDPLYRTALQGRDRGLQSSFHSSAGEELQGRATHTIRWDSPSFSGVQLGAHYTLDSNEATEDENPYGIGASYSNGGILAFADYMDNAQSGASEKNAWKVGGKYDMGMFSFMGQYEDYQNSSTDEETAWHVAGGVNGLLGMNLYLGFGITEDDTSNDEATSWTLAVSHNMSKRTMVYAGHSQVDCDTGTTLSACSAVGASGGEDDRTAFGIKHKF
ncbi:MAG TPA: porin [Gammaproteobacteria bacterium]|jgi:predicted porin|nr:porin [Gammaproteobacteria bacterium]